MKRKILFILLFSLPFFIELPSSAKPFIPKDDSQILEKLPKSSISLTKEFKKLRPDLKKGLNDKERAINFAKRCIEAGQSESDERYFSYADNTLKPFYKNPDSEILLLRALVKQRNHNFRAALQDLKLALNLNPLNPQGWLTKAQIHSTLGEYEEAKKSCVRLLNLSYNQLGLVTCASYPASLSGEADKSFKLLKNVVENSIDSPLVSNAEKVWSLGVLADIAFRMGNYKESERYYKSALRINPNDIFLLTSYSDFLLKANKHNEVVLLLKGKENIDGLLLRIALAEKELNTSLLKKHVKDLSERFKVNKLRGSEIHLREESIFNLMLLEKPHVALALAKKNWETQKEPIDARIFLEAAVEMKNKQSANNVIKFIKENKLEDITVSELIKELEGQVQ